MRTTLSVVLAVTLGFLVDARAQPLLGSSIELGARPALLVADLPAGELKSRLEACLAEPPRRTAFSIGDRKSTRLNSSH